MYYDASTLLALKHRKITVIPRRKGRPESLGHEMQKQSSLDKLQRVDPDIASGELDELLREIEKEPVPERLLELALKLQAALLEQRRQHESEGRSTEA